MRIVIGKILQLVVGGLLGCLVGGLLTGNENYWIALAVGAPLLITVAGIVGAGAASQGKKLGRPMTLRQGISSTIPGFRPKPQEAVLNPVSTAQPSTGVVLNGEVVGPVQGARPKRLPPWR